MTEEDTYNALKRRPFYEVRMVIRMMPIGNKRQAHIRKYLKESGWTEFDYQHALAESIRNGNEES